jgi:hypothetical protein
MESAPLVTAGAEAFTAPFFLQALRLRYSYETSLHKQTASVSVAASRAD